MSNRRFVIYEKSCKDFTYRPPPGLGFMDIELHHNKLRGDEFREQILLEGQRIRWGWRAMMQDKTSSKRRYETRIGRELGTTHRGINSLNQNIVGDVKWKT